MAEYNSIEHGFYETPNMYANLGTAPLNTIRLSVTQLSDQQQYRLNKINEIKDYFVAEIKEKELMSKRFSKYIASFDNFDKSLIVLSVTTDSISIASFATVIGAPVGKTSETFIFDFYRNCKKNC